MMKAAYDVIVLGAGIAGSSAAYALASKGWQTLVLDRHCFPRHKVCGEFLSPESRITLQQLGLWDTVGKLAASSIEHARICLGEGRMLEIPLPGEAYGISRYTLDHTLHQAAGQAGAHIETNALVTNVRKDDDGFEVEVRQQNRMLAFRAKCVIAAWGAYHRSADAGKRGRRASQALIGVKSHFTMGRNEQIAAVELYFFPGGYVGLSPVDNGAVNAAALVTRAFRERAASSSVLGLLEAAAQSNSSLAERLNGAVPIAGTQAAIAPIDLYRKPIVWGQFPHIGDSAVMIPPLCGDGMSIALYTAHCCSTLADRYLRKQISLASWQREYVKSVGKAVKHPIFWGRMLQRLTGLPKLPGMLYKIGAMSPRLSLSLVRATRLTHLHKDGRV